LIGTTVRSDACSKLEKRVVSRLNAQYVYQSPLSNEEVSQLMIHSLTPRCSGEERDTDTFEYFQRYRESIAEVFGTIQVLREEDDRLRTADMTNVSHDNYYDNNVEVNEKEKEQQPKTETPSIEFGFVEYLHDTLMTTTDLLCVHGEPYSYSFKRETKGAAATLLDTQIVWGRDRSYFLKLARHLLLQLNQAHPVITTELLQIAIESEEKPMLVQLLSALSSYELALYAAVARLQCQQFDSTSREISIDDIVTDFDKFTDVVTKGVSWLCICVCAYLMVMIMDIIP
jgi:hypothetical protein